MQISFVPCKGDAATVARHAFAEIADWHTRQAKEYADKATGLALTVKEQNGYLQKMAAHEESAKFIRELNITS